MRVEEKELEEQCDTLLRKMHNEKHVLEREMSEKMTTLNFELVASQQQTIDANNKNQQEKFALEQEKSQLDTDRKKYSSSLRSR